MRFERRVAPSLFRRRTASMRSCARGVPAAYTSAPVSLVPLGPVNNKVDKRRAAPRRALGLLSDRCANCGYKSASKRMKTTAMPNATCDSLTYESSTTATATSDKRLKSREEEEDEEEKDGAARRHRSTSVLT